jgi:hypothetical protein
MVALRPPPVVFGLTDNTTVPFPLPEDPEVMLIQLDDSEAVQLHPDPALTEMFIVWPAGNTLTGFGLTV